MAYYPSMPEPPEQSRKQPSRRTRVFRPAVICVSVLLIAYGAVSLAVYLSDLAASRRTAREFREIAEAPDDTETPSESVVPETPVPAAAEAEEAPGLSALLPAVEYPNGYDVVPAIQKMRKRNEYIVGRITMEGLDEPVVLKDNVFFLDHDASGRRNSNGAIFMDGETNLMTRPYTILLYGHNMKTGAMFGRLQKYEDFAYCYQHRFFRVDTLFEEGLYEIFAVETISLTPGLGRYVSLPDLASLDREVRQAALDALISHSLHTVMLDVDVEDQLVLLVTCVGNDDERLIVAGRRLREGEKGDDPRARSGK